MSLFYLTLDRYSQYQPDKPVTEKNPGGGMGTKTLSAIDAWRRFYHVTVGEQLCGGAEILVVEPLWFRIRGGVGDLKKPDIDIAIEEYKNYSARIKVLYTSELALLKLDRHHREAIVDASTVVTTNCQFQENLFKAFNIPTMPLCDVTNPKDYYRPTTEKRLAIAAMGRISGDKNSQKVVEIFKALENKIERVYIGGASLWGYFDRQDLHVESQLKSNSDAFFNNVDQYEVAMQMTLIPMGIFDPFTTAPPHRIYRA